MNSNTTMIVSIENTKRIINSSILLLREADLQLSREGFLPLNGNKIGTEHNKDINQSPDQTNTFLPQFMSRFYVPNKAEIESRFIGLNIQLYHVNHENLVPCLIGATGRILQEGLKPRSWWLKYFAYETSMEFKPCDEWFSGEDEEAQVELKGIELSRLHDGNDLRNELLTELIAKAGSGTRKYA
ncbi:hypothetical protein SAMN05444162_3094 [Paenibacillaceae bacterium GAS479]|nr:hypothetical protein SAMN05444162_3094 [Paenibacillaceae bacterium GAS479]